MKFLCRSAVFALSLGCLWPAPAAARQPNIVFMLADDLGWMDTGFQGSEYYQTPHLDALAARGMTFSHAYSASPLCSPTRASLLTGQTPGRLRFTRPSGHYPEVVLDPAVPEKAGAQYKATSPDTRTRLPLNYRTLAEELQSHGYRTAFMGKWHLGSAPYLPEDQGFEKVIGGRANPGPPEGKYFAPWQPDANIPPVPEGTHIDDVLADQAIAYIEERKAEPFFLCLWFYDVHAPFEAKADLVAKYKNREGSNGQQCPEMAAMIETLDAAAGRVLGALDRLGLRDDTIVIFTSDNGGNMFDVVDGVYPTSNAPLRGGKGTNYEGGVRVPLVMAWGDKFKPGSKSDASVTSPDFYPTLLELTGNALLPEVHKDGVSFAAALRGEDYARPPIDSHFPHPYLKQNSRANSSLTDGTWKFYRYFFDADDATDRLELYNLADDVGERHNLAQSEPDRVAAMNAALGTRLAETAALIPAKNPAYDGLTRRAWHGKGEIEMRTDAGVLTVRSTGDAPRIETAFTPSLGGGRARFTFEIKSSAPVDGALYWTDKKNRKMSPDHRVTFEVTEPDVWVGKTLEFEVQGELRDLRLDPLNAPGEVSLRHLRLASDRGYPLAEWDF